MLITNIDNNFNVIDVNANVCDYLAPKWKGRPRKVRKKRSNSPGSESNESESSVSTVTSSTRVRSFPPP